MLRLSTRIILNLADMARLLALVNTTEPGTNYDASVSASLEIDDRFCGHHLSAQPSWDGESMRCCAFEMVPCNSLLHDHNDCRCGQGHECGDSCPPLTGHPLEQLAQVQLHPSNARGRLDTLEQENTDLKERIARLEEVIEERLGVPLCL